MPPPVEAPPAPAPQAPAAPAAAPEAPPTPELHVTPQTVVDKGPPQPAPKKGSVRDQMFQDLRKKAGAEEPTEPPRPEATKPETTPTATETPDKKKVSPWKLVDEFKSRAAQLEQQLAEAKKSLPDPKEREEMTTKLTAAEKRLQELEEEIRFTNYKKSREYQEKYEKPYEDAWKRAMGDLSELVIDDGGEGRQMSPEDMLELVRLPLQKARERAKELFGDFADDVMAHRKEIKRLADDQSRALEEARKNGEAREKERQQKLRELHQNFQKTVGEMWKQSNETMAKDEKTGRFLRPVEGDEEGNKRLARGFELADKAFSVSPLDPKLTAEERASVVKLHSAIRNRAAAAGRLILWNEKLTAQVESLKAELAKYQSAEPGLGEGKKTEAPVANQSARSQVIAALHKIAH